jgi:hypothetical protein
MADTATTIWRILATAPNELDLMRLFNNKKEAFKAYGLVKDLYARIPNWEGYVLLQERVKSEWITLCKSNRAG